MEELLQKVRALELKTRRLVDSTFGGEYHTAFKGNGIEFDEVRPYQLGDDVKRIDWNVTARSNQAFVKVFREERELSLTILFDISRSHDFGKGEYSKRKVGTEVAAVLAFSALRNNDKVGLITCSEHIEHYFPPRKGKKYVLKLIRNLLVLEPRFAGTNLIKGLNFLMRVLKQRGIVVLISDFLDEGFFTALTRLNKNQDVVLIHLYHPDEALPGLSGVFPVSDLESQHKSWIRLKKNSGGRKQGQLLTAGRKELSDFCGKHKMGYVPIDTTQDYVPVLERFFQQRKG